MPEETNSAPTPEITPSVLNKPVPNPLAKNPNVHTHKVFASVGLILIGVLGILFGAAYVFGFDIASLFNNNSPTEETTTTKVATDSAKTSDKYKTSPIFGKRENITSTQLDTSGWLEYKTELFSIKYPPNFTKEEGKNYISLNSPDHKFDLGVQIAGTSVSISSDETSKSYDTLEKFVDNSVKDDAYKLIDFISLDDDQAARFIWWKGDFNSSSYSVYEIAAVKNEMKFTFLQYFPPNADELDTSLIDTIATTFKFL